MDTKQLWKGLTDEQREELAKGAQTTPNYLYLVFLGHKKISADMATRIERSAEAIGLAIPRKHWRPDIFA